MTLSSLQVTAAAAMPAAGVLDAVGGTSEGLTGAEADTRLQTVGPNAMRSHRARPWAVLMRQVHSPLLVLLVVTAAVSFFVGERSDAVIIGVIVGMSVGLGFVNEYRAERAVEALHEQLRHRVVVRRDGAWTSVDLVDIVPGDVVRLGPGAIVPADVRLLAVNGLECDEGVLTGESAPVEKAVEAVAAGTAVADARSCALMGTVVRTGEAEGVVVATGGATEFGRIALGLGERQEETEFQAGLRRFSGLLAVVAIVLTSSIFVINLVLQRPFIDALLFSLAIAVGITPQLLPAVVTTSLATGSRRLAHRKVLVKRLVCIEDLGNTELLLTDKTGTLTEGEITFQEAADASGRASTRVLLLGLLCNEATVTNGTAVGGNPLDVALWNAPGAPGAGAEQWNRLDVLPFDHDRRRTVVLVEHAGTRLVVVKGAPEGVLAGCTHVASTTRAAIDDALASGGRVVAVATKETTAASLADAAPGEGLTLEGFIVFLDPPKRSAAAALSRLEDLGIDVKIVTGDHPAVAAKVCQELGVVVRGAITGAELDTLDDAALAARVDETTIFSRVNPDQKSRIIRAHQRTGRDVAYMGDGVNDAVALHKADVGISVDTATDVAKDAADVLLLEKDLHVLADGVVEGRRTFANTIKYVLMGTSSNFGNMFSAAAASAFLPFLPMLPSQILLNNLLYDTSQMTIPTDRVDEEQLARPSHWDIAFIRRFMLFFGPISSLFDFLTFAVMLHVFHAGADLFRSGWFVESLATQTLVIFVIRTRRTPFFRSRPSKPLFLATIAAVLVGAALPMSPLADSLGFVALPAGYFAALTAMVAGYLVLTETAKYLFYGHLGSISGGRTRAERRVHRRAARFSLG